MKKAIDRLCSTCGAEPGTACEGFGWVTHAARFVVPEEEEPLYLSGFNAGIEAAAKVVEEEVTQPTLARQPYVARAIRALKRGST